MMSLIQLLAFLIVNYTFWYVFKRLGFKAEHFMFMFLIIVLTAITVIMVFKY